MIPDLIQNKIWEFSDIRKHIAELKSKGKKIVFTNGVFDIVHAGHVSYLAETSQLGDFLIVGLNSDDSVRSLGKSPARPLQNQQSRAAVLASLQWVNAVVVFDEPTPEKLIHEVKPDILVKGNDYHQSNIAGADFVLSYGGEVKTIPLVEGYSTTAIEQKIIKEHTQK